MALVHWSLDTGPWLKHQVAAPTYRGALAGGMDPHAVNVMPAALCTPPPTSSAHNTTERVLAHISENTDFESTTGDEVIS